MSTRGNPYGVAQRLLEEGNHFLDLELFSEAMARFKAASDTLAYESGDPIHVALLNSVGKLQILRGQYQQAETSLNQALELAISIDDRAGRALSLGYLGTCAEKQGAYIRALELQQASMAQYVALEDQVGMALAKENMGSIYEDIGELELAYKHFMEAYRVLKDSASSQTANVLNNLGDVRRKQGKYKEAEKYTQRALDLARGIQDIHQMESAHKDLAKTYASIGDFHEAYTHLLEADTYRAQELEAWNTSQLNAIQALYDSDRKASEILLLREQNKVSRANQILIGALALSTFITFLMVFLYSRRKRRVQQRVQELEQQQLKADMQRITSHEDHLKKEIKVKSAALTRYSLNLSQKNKILMGLSRSLGQMADRSNANYSDTLRSLRKEIEFNLSTDEEWDDFLQIFEEIHPAFMKRLNGLGEGKLTPSELRLGMLLRMNLTSKEIASILRVTPDSVRVARYRLRKKLPIGSKEELVSYLVEL
ncbi:tetratricopeptide repeat protein [Robiginitalea sediminis]|uniref:tetratricopeptide repeat protein n=1 Tax=Robiginitalea sediminis TaxID=1982593 RepID=UPI001303C89C|nr:tetratricopeptide repeat protein [Robiginitalea sediminis]